MAILVTNLPYIARSGLIGQVVFHSIINVNVLCDWLQHLMAIHSLMIPCTSYFLFRPTSMSRL